MNFMNLEFKHSKGFSLLEAMVAAFIFATGILGVAGLQLKSLNMISNSGTINVAMMGANDLADRMRANPVGVEGDFYYFLSENGSQNETPNCTSSCSPAELAAYDISSVKNFLEQGLPEAALNVARVSGDVFSIEVEWKERIGTISSTKNHTLSFVPYKP